MVELKVVLYFLIVAVKKIYKKKDRSFGFMRRKKRFCTVILPETINLYKKWTRVPFEYFLPMIIPKPLNEIWWNFNIILNWSKSATIEFYEVAWLILWVKKNLVWNLRYDPTQHSNERIVLPCPSWVRSGRSGRRWW